MDYNDGRRRQRRRQRQRRQQQQQQQQHFIDLPAFYGNNLKQSWVGVPAV